MSGTRNPYGHIDLRVRDMEEALAFYQELLPALGFHRFFSGENFKTFAADGELPSAPFFGFTEDPDHVPNQNRIAFWAADRAEVDAIGALLVKLDADIESGPRVVSEYSDSYYAVFFRDPSGNALEVVHRVN